MKISTIIFFVLTACFFIEISQKNEPKLYQKPQKLLSGVANIVDGDTVKIDGNRIRLIFIDAPETKQKCYDKNGKKYSCGVMSTQFLRNLVQGEEIQCFYDKKDIYKRFLAECFYQNRSLNKEMVANGMAIVYSFKKFPPLYKKAQEKAKKQGLGIWQGEFEIPKYYRKRTKNR